MAEAGGAASSWHGLPARLAYPHRGAAALLAAAVTGILVSPLARADAPDWCRTRCAELFFGELPRPACKRYEIEYVVEDEKAVPRRRYIQSCMQQYAAWSARVDRRKAATDALGRESACVEWCSRLARLRAGIPLGDEQAEIWDVLSDTNVCALSGGDLADLALLEVSARCAGMVLIPDGEFGMGCSETVQQPGNWCVEAAEEFGVSCVRAAGQCHQDEKPFHQVLLPAFFIDQHEVTVAAYQACVDAGGCTQPRSNAVLQYYNWDNPDRALHPVNGVDWNQAAAFCAWGGKRLCTEAEWEKGARGPDGRLFPWGDAIPTARLAVLDSPGDRIGEDLPWPVLGITEQVCSRTDGNSPYGLCDMAGNAAEWVADWYDPAYYPASPAASPAGPPEGLFRVIRGGRYNHVGFSVRASARSFFDPDDRFAYLGFRCCADPDHVSAEK